MSTELTDGLIALGATLGGAALGLVGYKLWQHGFFGRRKKYSDLRHAQYNSGPLLQSIAKFQSAFATASATYRQQHNELAQLIAQQEILFTEKQRNLLTKWEHIAATLSQHCQNKPEISEAISTQHEADLEIKTLTEYTVALNQLLDTCSTEYQVLIGEFQTERSLQLTMS